VLHYQVDEGICYLTAPQARGLISPRSECPICIDISTCSLHELCLLLLIWRRQACVTMHIFLRRPLSQCNDGCLRSLQRAFFRRKSMTLIIYFFSSRFDCEIIAVVISLRNTHSLKQCSQIRICTAEDGLHSVCLKWCPAQMTPVVQATVGIFWRK